MKLHLPVSLFRSLLTCMAMVCGTTLATVSAATTYPNGSKTYTTRQTSALTLKGYERIWFKDIDSFSPFGFAYGGAIYNEDRNATFTLSGNGDVTFSGNTASAFSDSAYGGAISNSNYATFTLSGNGDVTFSGNTASSSCDSAYGGAISNSNYATFTLSGNGNVTFSGNSVSFDDCSVDGGAIYNIGTFTLSDNASVTFSGNSVSFDDCSVYGGAIYNDNGGTFTLSGNGDVTFSGNKALYGGAIYNRQPYSVGSTFTLSGNGAVTFSGNKASYSYDYDAKGGAIYNDNGGTFTLSDNGDVTFSGNTASGDYAYGGAIYNGGTFTLSGNGDVTFRGNKASTYYLSTEGGAIYNEGNNATFTLSDNGDVTFEQNAEYDVETYRLRSIYSTGTLNLSASAGKSILFKDSVYARGTVNLNQDGTGDIIFTGATTEADLREVKGGIAGSENEVRNSRSSVLYAEVTLYNGTLQVQDAASLTVKNLTAVNGTILELDDATFMVAGTATLADVAVSGNSVIVVGDSGLAVELDATISLQKVISNSGTLTFVSASTTSVGTLDVSALTLTSVAATHIDTNGKSGASGFARTAGYSVQLVNGGTTVNRWVTVKHGTRTLTLNSNGTATSGCTVDYGTYLLTGTGTAATSAIHGKNSTATIKQTGGTLTVNDTATVNATAGKIKLSGGTLEGTLRNVGITATSGTIAADVSGNGTLTVGGNVKVTGKVTSAVTLNSGNLTAGNGMKLVSGQGLTFNGGNMKGDIQTGTGSTLTVKNNATLTGGLTLNGGTVALNGKTLALTGTLNLMGATTLDIADYGVGDYKLLSFSKMTGSLNNLSLNSNRYGYALSKVGNELLLNIHIHNQTWDRASGTWKNNAAFGDGIFVAGNDVKFSAPAAVTISGAVAPGSVTVGNTTGTVTFKAANTSSGIAGKTKLTKSGAGTLVMNNGNTYTGGTVISAGTVNAGGATAFGTGTIAMKGGTLNLGSHAVANTIKVTGGSHIKGTAYKGALTIAANLGSGTNLSLAKTATLSKGKVTGVLTGAAGVKVTGEATLAGKNTYKGTTAVAAGALLHLTGTVAGNYSVSGTLDASQKAITLGSGKAMTVADGGVVTGKVTVNSGATLTVKGTKSKLGTTVVNGGTAVLNSTAATIQATGTGTSSVTVKGKKLTLGTNKSTLKMAATEAVNLNSGKLTINAVSSTYTGNLVAKGGTLDLASRTVKNNVYLYKATLAHAGALRGTLCVRDAAARYSGSLTLTSNNKLNFSAGSKLTVTGTLTLKGGTALTLAGSGWKAGRYTLMSAGTLSGKAATAFKVAKLSGFTSALTNSGKNVVLTLRKSAAKAAAAPDLTEEPALAAAPALAAEPMAEPTVTVPAVSADAKAAQSMADALVQADWAVVDAARAFTSGIRNRSTGTLTPDGKGAVWMNAIGSLARHSSMNGHSGSQVNLYGGAVGAEHHIGEHHSIGAAVGGTHANIGNTPMGKLRQDTTHVALYGNSRMGSKFSADWAAAFGSTNAHGNLGDARAKWQQNSTELSARLTYAEMLNDNTQLRTFAGLDYDATDADRTNGGKTGSVQALRGEFGMGLTHATETYSLYGEVGMVGDMVRHNPVAEADGFRLKGANPGRIGLKATLGGSIRLNDTWSANASYNLETAADATMQSVNVGASRKF